MIRIRTGESWKHDPVLRAALREGSAAARSAAARAAVDALAIEVDGFDIAAGQAEGPLLPSLEALLRAVARVVGGAPHAAVAFRDGELQLVIRRRDQAALLTVVELSRPSRVLARDVEVEVDALAAAALEASADLCRELGALLPSVGEREARRLHAAERALRGAPSSSRARPGARRSTWPDARAPRRAGRVTLALKLEDDEGQLDAYEGSRPDLGSLLVPGRLVLRSATGAPLAAFPGIPFLALRDLGAGVDRLLTAMRAGERTLELALARPGRGGVTTLALDLAQGTVSVGGGAAEPCPPLELARAVADAARELVRVARARNPRQAENAHVAELEAAAADRLAQIEELAEGDRAPATAAAPIPAPAPRPVSQRPLGSGRLRRVAFRRTFELDVGAPAGEGLHARGGVVLVSGAAAVAAIERASGRILWRAPGAEHAAALPGAVLVARAGELDALAPRSGRRLWSRPLPVRALSSAFALAHGPFVLSGAGALVALDPGTGRTLWRFEPPGAARVVAAPFGGIAAAASDTGAIYGVDAAGRTVWRVRLQGPPLHAPVHALGIALVSCAAGAAAATIALDPATGVRRFEAPLDFAPSAPPVAWGRRVALAGAVAGDPVVAVLGEDGARAWTVAPPLAGAPAIAATGPLLVAIDPDGALVALGRDGASRWSRPAPKEPPPAGATAPAIARATVVVAGDGIAALDARTGELLGAVSGVAPARLAVDAALGVAAMDADGLTTGWRVATHLSLV